jgi:hypothetical protein
VGRRRSETKWALCLQMHFPCFENAYSPFPAQKYSQALVIAHRLFQLSNETWHHLFLYIMRPWLFLGFHIFFEWQTLGSHAHALWIFIMYILGYLDFTHIAGWPLQL